MTGGEIGDTNVEAERRAREKGLLEAKKKHHFQSMDEVDQTAISWTLGKMVIEASKAVQPRSLAIEGAWLEKLHLHGIEHRLNDMGIQTIWAIGFVGFALAVCLFTQVRRKFRLFGYGGNQRRGRKPSFSQGPPISPTSGGWCWPLRASSDSGSGYSSLEEGFDLTPTKPSRPAVGRLRVWSLRLSSFLRRKVTTLPFHRSETRSRTMRHASMPLTSSYSYRNSSEGYQSSQPSSPRSNSFFVPATSAQVSLAPLSRPPSAAPEGRNATLATTSPPRTKAVRPFQARQFSGVPYANSSAANGSEKGWNDPPNALFALPFGDVGTPGSGGGLTPNMGGISGLGTGFEPPLSRKSSRINLNEMGLAQRSTSRAGTPFDQ